MLRTRNALLGQGVLVMIMSMIFCVTLFWARQMDKKANQKSQRFKFVTAKAVILVLSSIWLVYAIAEMRYWHGWLICPIANLILQLAYWILYCRFYTKEDSFFETKVATHQP